MWFRLFVCLIFFSLPAFAQKATPGMPPPPKDDIIQPMGDAEDARTRVTGELAKKAAKERVAAIRHDTDRLLRLSVELKESVDKSNENVLSLDVIKKAEEIEKLAKSVKERMKGPN